jgi:hypothetical protein
MTRFFTSEKIIQMLPATTVFFNGVTAAVADVALNDVSRVRDFASLQQYFSRHGIMQAASYAAITVMIGAIAVILTTRGLFGFDVPHTSSELLLALAVCFGVGWGMDVAIAKANVFPDLKQYYARHGSGFWGALSLVVSMAISLAVQRFLLPRLL